MWKLLNKEHFSKSRNPRQVKIKVAFAANAYQNRQKAATSDDLEVSSSDQEAFSQQIRDGDITVHSPPPKEVVKQSNQQNRRDRFPVESRSLSWISSRYRSGISSIILSNASVS